MSWEAFEQALEAGRVPPVLIFYGTDRTPVEQALKDVHRAAGDCRLIRFEGDLSALDEELYTPSLFGERKIVFVETDALPKDWLKRVRRSPPDGVLLVWYVRSGRAPMKSAEGALVVNAGEATTSVGREIKLELRRLSKSMDPGAVEKFLERRGGGVSGLRQELEKLAAFVGTRERIRAADVEALVPDQGRSRGFDLVDRIAEGRPGPALQTLHRLLRQGEPVPRLIGGLAWQIRKMVDVKRRMLAGEPAVSACRSAGIRFRAAEFARRVSGIPLETLLACHDRLLQADRTLKTSGGVGGPVLEIMVADLAVRLGSTPRA